MQEIKGKFPLGMVVATSGVQSATTKEERLSALTRHVNGDWGDICSEGIAANEEALQRGFRLMSVYRTMTEGTKFWIITEHDRSMTTLLLPEEY